MRQPGGAAVLLAYAAFVLLGVGAGAGGVLLLAQLGDYSVDRATIGITFFTGSAGFILAGFSTGALIDRFGARIALTIGGAAYLLAALYLATRPPFAAFVLVQLVIGYGSGVLESALNAYLAAQRNATTLLNRLHAFFGVGALLGPVLASWIVGFTRWTVVWLVLAAIAAPLVVGFLVAYPRLRPADQAKANETTMEGRLLPAVLRERAVLLAATMLAVYVGLELSVGNWGFSYLVQRRGLPELLAGYSVSAYWLGLTAGRLLISPVATRLGASTIGLMHSCLAGVTLAALLAWLSPVAVLASVSLALLGFFLGPIFPTTMAITAELTSARRAPTAIGIMNAGSVVGGSALPWLAGAIAQGIGIWTLMPFVLMLAVLQVAVWRPIAARIRAAVPVEG